LEDKERIVLEAMEKIGRPVRPGDVAKATGLESKEVSKIKGLLGRRGGLFLRNDATIHWHSE